MICPACGAPDQLGDECVACGIVFARWRSRDAKPPAPPRNQPVPHTAPSRANHRIVLSSVGALVLVGLIWASTRSAESPDSHTPAAADAARTEPTVVAAAETTQITDEQIRRLIEDCSFFQEHLTVTFPKSVHGNLMALQDPRLTLAANMGIVEFDPPIDVATASRRLPNPASPGLSSLVRLGPNAPGAAITDEGNRFRLDLGRRRVEKLSGVQRSEETIGLFYKWTLEKSELRYFAPDHDDFMGGAELRRSAGRWKARVWRNTRASALILCEPK